MTEKNYLLDLLILFSKYLLPYADCSAFSVEVYDLSVVMAHPVAVTVCLQVPCDALVGLEGAVVLDKVVDMSAVWQVAAEYQKSKVSKEVLSPPRGEGQHFFLTQSTMINCKGAPELL